MAKDAQAEAAQNVSTAKTASNASVLAARLRAVQEAGNMTPKMQKSFDRFAAKINR